MIARRAHVFGRVQGVFFRAWARDQARALGAAGWVRNCADGSVEVHIEGKPEAVQQLIELLHDGPPQASVDRVERVDAEVENFECFEIRH